MAEIQVEWKCGQIRNPDGVPRWDVYMRSNGTVLVENDAPNGELDDEYACLGDLIEGLYTGYAYHALPVGDSDVTEAPLG